jgi:hypothetical protein
LNGWVLERRIRTGKLEQCEVGDEGYCEEHVEKNAYVNVREGGEGVGCAEESRG